MKRALLLSSLFLGLALPSATVWADDVTVAKQRIADSVIQTSKYTTTIDDLKKQDTAMKKAGYDFVTDQRIHRESLIALVGRAIEYGVQKRWEESRIDYSQANYHAMLLINDPANTTRQATFLIEQARCLFEMGQYSKALTTIGYAKTSSGWQGGDVYQFPVIIRVHIALENFNEAIKNCVAWRAEIERVRSVTKNNSVLQTEQQNSYIFEAAALYLKGDLTGARTKWQEIAKVNPELAKFDIFDPEQAPLNLAVDKNPNDLVARANRARFFSAKADEVRDKEETVNLRGGLQNLYNTEQLAPQKFSFDEAAYFDWNAALAVKKEPLFMAERAYSAHYFNKSPLTDRKFSPKTVRADIDGAAKTGFKDVATMRRLGDYYNGLAFENTTPTGINEDYYANAIHYYSLAILAGLDTKTTADLRFTVRSLTNDYLGDWRAIEDRKPNIQPATPLKTALQWKEFGNELRAKNELKSALAAFDEALKIDPKFADALNNKGNIYLDLNAYEKALEMFNEAIKIDPKHRVAYTNRAIVWDNTHEPQKAIEDATKGIQFAITPDQKGLALSKRQAFYFDAGQLDLGLADNAALLELKPDHAPTLIIGAQMQLEKQPPNLNAAQKAVQKAITVNATAGGPQLMLAYILHMRDEHEMLPGLPNAAQLQWNRALPIAKKEDFRWISVWLRSGRLSTDSKTPQGMLIASFLKLVDAEIAK